jgi:hypothetical protein
MMEPGEIAFHSLLIQFFDEGNISRFSDCQPGTFPDIDQVMGKKLNAVITRV